MENLDLATQHWLDQGGQADVEIRGHQAMWEASQEPSGESWQERHTADIDDAVAAAAIEVSGRDEDREDWNASRKDRDELAESESNFDLNNYLNQKILWLKDFQRDPVGAEERYVRAWARTSPFHPKVAKQQEETPPEDWREDGKREFQLEADIRRALRESNRNQADARDFETTAQTR